LLLENTKSTAPATKHSITVIRKINVEVFITGCILSGIISERAGKVDAKYNYFSCPILN
jgi:hypothetical protein